MEFVYRSGKRYGHERGLSCAFRQWRATHSHCSQLHGYSLAFSFEFGTNELNDLSWVMDFGSLGGLKEDLAHAFDHKMAVALDDPQLDTFRLMEARGLCQLTLMPAVGCERFAEYAFQLAEHAVAIEGQAQRVTVISATCAEHDSNWATYVNPNLVPQNVSCD